MMMMIMSTLHYTNTLSLDGIAIAPYDNSTRVDSAPLVHIILLPSHPVCVVTFNDVCTAEKQNISIFLYLL